MNEQINAIVGIEMSKKKYDATLDFRYLLNPPPYLKTMLLSVKCNL